MSRYRFVELSGMQDCPHRLDQSFTWKSSDFGDIGGSQYRISVTVRGDKVGSFSEWLKIPETWSVSQRETREKRNVFVNTSYLPILVLCLALAVFFFWRVHAHDIRWRWSFIVGGIYALTALLVQFNRLPFAYLSYDTAQSLGTFWMENLSKPFFVAVFSFIFAVPIVAASTAAGRLYLADKPGTSRVFTASYLVSKEASKQVLVGYRSAFLFIGYATVFYVFGQRFLGVLVAGRGQVQQRILHLFSIFHRYPHRDKCSLRRGVDVSPIRHCHTLPPDQEIVARGRYSRPYLGVCPYLLSPGARLDKRCGAQHRGRRIRMDIPSLRIDCDHCLPLPLRCVCRHSATIAVRTTKPDRERARSAGASPLSPAPYPAAAPLHVAEPFPGGSAPGRSLACPCATCRQSRIPPVSRRRSSDSHEEPRLLRACGSRGLWRILHGPPLGLLWEGAFREAHERPRRKVVS